MSGGLAYAAAPARPLRPQALRHVEVVTTSVQRRARPKLAYALVGVVGLFAIFLAQLLLSIALSDGAYRISNLVGEKRDLSRTEQSLIEQLELMASSQNLAATAQSLGMVGSTNPAAYLRLSDGTVLGAVTAAAPGALGATTVPNSLLAEAGQPFGGPMPAADDGLSTASDASTPEAIPSPVTR